MRLILITRHYYTVVKQKDSRTIFPEFKSCLHQLENLGQVSCSISLCLSFLKLLLFSHSVMSDSLWPHGLQLARPPCPSPSPGGCSSSCYLNRMIMIRIANTACVCVFSCVWLFANLQTLACQAPLSMEFSRQEYQSGLPFPSPWDLPDPEIKPMSFVSLALADGFFTNCAT